MRSGSPGSDVEAGCRHTVHSASIASFSSAVPLSDVYAGQFKSPARMVASAREMTYRMILSRLWSSSPLFSHASRAFLSPLLQQTPVACGGMLHHVEEVAPVTGGAEDARVHHVVTLLEVRL